MERPTLINILCDRAAKEPEKMAYTFLVDGKHLGPSLTYGELDRQARAIASHLQSRISLGDRVLLIYPQGLEFIAAFFGCLYAGVIAIPAPAPEASRLKRIRPRLESIVADARCSVILCNSKVLSQLEPFIKEFDNNNLSWIATDSLSEESEREWFEPKIDGSTIAYLQYTSGSTSAPKGVAIAHNNLIDNLNGITRAHGYNSESICITWIPYFHDYGLVNGILQPLHAGRPCFITSPVTFIKSPIRWLSAISDYGVTHSGGPYFAYEYCLRKIAPEQCQGLNLKLWRVAHTGAEPIRRETLELFARKFEPYGFDFQAFYPSYGLAEATLMVTTKRTSDAPSFCTVSRQGLSRGRAIAPGETGETENRDRLSLTGCGYPTGDTKVAIVNPQILTPCASEEVGEIWVSGSSVGKGYWNRPDVTERTFHAYLADTGEGPFLRTGDLGFLKNGELFVTGRLKDIIIVKGSNHYPQDIELTVQQSHPALRPGGGVAFSVDIESQERVVVVQEVNRNHRNSIDTQEIFRTIRQAVSARHEIQLYAIALIRQGSIPKTSSGKIMRHTCQANFTQGKLDAIAFDIRK